MRARRCLLLAAAVLPGGSPAVAVPPEPLPDALRWEHRVIVYQAGDEETGQAVREAAVEHAAAFADRRILFLPLPGMDAAPEGLPPGHRALAPAEVREIRKRWEIEAGATVFLLLGLDGTVKERRASLPDWKAWCERIDRMPMRRRELRPREGS